MQNCHSSASDYIKRNKDTHYEQGFKLLQKPETYISLVKEGLNPENPEWEKYAKYTSGYNLTGKFINLPSYAYMTENDFDVLIALNQSHFKKSDRDFENLVGEIKEVFNSKFKETGNAYAQRAGKALELTIHFKKINTREDIKTFVTELDFLLSIIKVIA